MVAFRIRQRNVFPAQFKQDSHRQTDGRRKNTPKRHALYANSLASILFPIRVDGIACTVSALTEQHDLTV